MSCKKCGDCQCTEETPKTLGCAIDNGIEKATNSKSKHDLVSYIGVKLIKAMPCSEKKYKQIRGWKTNTEEDREGYLVEYPLMELDEKTNVPGFDGYVSWSPKTAFELAYIKTEKHLNFIQATAAMAVGKLVYKDEEPEELRTYLGFCEAGFFYLMHKNLTTPYVPTKADIMGKTWVVANN